MLVNFFSNIDFLGKQKIVYLFSFSFIVIMLSVLFLNGGFKYGVDFIGGILIQVRFESSTDALSIKKALKSFEMNDIAVQKFGKREDIPEYLIRFEKNNLPLEIFAESVQKELESFYFKKFEIRRVEAIGPKVSEDLKRQSFFSVFYVFVFIMVYISGRFEKKWFFPVIMASLILFIVFLFNYFSFLIESEKVKFILFTFIILGVLLTVCFFFRLGYALGAIMALLHDTLIVLGVLGFLSKEITLPVVAALLTIIGYSLNDTLVVFDRIRENIETKDKIFLRDLINHSINQTLVRTVITSTTTFIAVLSLWIFGGKIIGDFAFVLLVGILVGTYSSIFIASSFLCFILEKK